MKRLRSFDEVNSASDNKGSRPSSSHRDFHFKSDSCRLGMGSSPYAIRYDRLSEEDREGSRSARKRMDNVPDNFDRRKGYRGYASDRLYRSSSFCGSRREYPKGYRSERGHSRKDASVSSLRRFHCSKAHEEKGSGEKSRSVGIKTSSQMHTESTSSSEMEEGELEPEPPQFQNNNPEDRFDSPEKVTVPSTSENPLPVLFQEAEGKASDREGEETDRAIEQFREEETGDGTKLETGPSCLLEDKSTADEISQVEPKIIPPAENTDPRDVKPDRIDERSPTVVPEEDSTVLRKGETEHHSSDDDDDDGGLPLECTNNLGGWESPCEAEESTDVPMCFELFADGSAAAAAACPGNRKEETATLGALELSLSLPNAPRRFSGSQPTLLSEGTFADSLTRDSLENHKQSVASRPNLSELISRHQERNQAGTGMSETPSPPRFPGSVRTMISMIVSEPLHAVSGWFRDLPDRTVAFMKDGVSELLTDREGLLAVQGSLRGRSDLTLEGLRDCPRPLLEVMTSLRTAHREFLRMDAGISASSLAEVFLDLRCRNPSCMRRVPADGCDCRICSRKPGFCSLCMCLLCGNFDAASNTCAWVGCDFCLHWCHADCGLEKNHICAASSSEVQFHCTACGHASEMYGFVREVFRNFAATWPLETLSTELEYVRRIFRPSADVRGKQLLDLADELRARLDASRLPPDPADIYNPVLFFFSEGGSAKKAGAEGKRRWNDELERVARIKEAEARMFQARADAARREAEGLRRIADAKSEKMEEEFSSRIAKLHLPETEESRRLKLDHLHALDRAHLDYLNMKLRMEADIKDLLTRMELTQRNLAI